MKSEDLFAAIGGVESSRLACSELTVNQSSHNAYKEENKMNQKKPRLLRGILVAALIVTMLATTVFAAAGFILFDNPKQMIAALFGNNTGYDHSDWNVPDYKGDAAAEYHADRTPVDDNTAEELVPQAEAVGQSITYAGHTLTVDANLYDADTKCGFVTYSIENPNGVRSYDVGPTGEVIFPYGDLLVANYYGRSYIIQEQCTDTRLCATYYYQTGNSRDSKLEMKLSFWAAVEEPQSFLADETNRTDLKNSPDSIKIPLKTSSTIHTVRFENGAVSLSPFSVQVKLSQLPASEYEFISEMTLVFRDGTKYAIKNDNTYNCLLEVADETASEIAMVMNRLVDLDNVAAITVNGSEISMD